MEITADTVEAVRRKIAELELVDIARVGHADVLTFEVSAREITAAVSPGTHDDDDAVDRPRPSGWSLPS